MKEEVVKEQHGGIEWVLSEKLYCLFCGHRGLWLGDDSEGVEHLCTACNTLFIAHPAVLDIRYSLEAQQARRAQLQQREERETA